MRRAASSSRAGRLTAAGALGLAFLLVGPAKAADHAATLRLTRLPAGEAPLAFTLPTPGGGTVSLADLAGKVVLLNFWATWCEPCLEEMPAMERLSRVYRERGLVVLAVSVDREGVSVVRPFLARHRLTFPVGLDPGQAVARLYRVWALPSTFVFSRKGLQLFSAQGAREWDGPAGRALIEELLAGDS